MACLMVAMLKAGLNLGRRIEGGRGKVGQVGWLIGRTDTRCAVGYEGFAISCGSFTRIPFWAILFFSHTRQSPPSTIWFVLWLFFYVCRYCGWCYFMRCDLSRGRLPDCNHGAAAVAIDFQLLYWANIHSHTERGCHSTRTIHTIM